MKKVFVLDTNVLLHDPQALLRFKDNDVVIPITVVEEIDTFKKDLNETGRNAREVSRLLDSFRAKAHLVDGVRLDDGGMLKVFIYTEQAMRRMPPELRVDRGDNRILAVALQMKEECHCPVVFVTKDTNLRIKADAVGLNAQDYESDKVSIEELYTGMAEVVLPREQVDRFYGQGHVDIDGDYRENQCLTLVDESNTSHTALGRYEAALGRVVPLIRLPKEGLWGITPRNREQQFAFDLLLNDDIQLVTLVGKAGTGKTLLAIAAGLAKSADEGGYSRLLVSRPIFPLGRDLGFLPGDVEEKLAPWMQPIFDNVELLLGMVDEHGKRKRGYKELVEMGLLQIEPLTYIRGRSIPKQFMIVDEAQNLTPHEIKTIITRAGEGTKIVLTGDPYQIDNPYIDSSSNGLTYTVEKFKSQSIAGHVTLMRGERSPLAELAANLL
ncbi:MULTISPECIES: PhoH family protein [Syntrophotalea]|jgi:PhoH-like ATPase|uniref:Phosphate starvation-inducible protein PhoH n=1 Tax=Syntrophotalea acetylenica TaxID=29542 RepID=A0A1L3GJA3_SYNAC|nr:PhoH family protein [Syntrophotalea acetylenica]APG25991.1 phosphate starvation-inducible protein PhoH [Syntrophotalea acetylenica]APG44057.1 phosphate starvation-inducible protein PhoH [Syntrophotalea acetylenica]MDY0262942.1 PhoH family protein [Syntrophotalea acetylenica]